jgi:5'-nucleotidase
MISQASPVPEDRMTRPRVLLTNDDGWEAEGLRALGEVLAGLAELVVVAPERERSGIGCAVTLKEPIRARRADFPGAAEAWVVSGTPADCAKLAITTLYPSGRVSRPFAVCFSGLNRGPNIGVNVFYSGTVGAVFEAAVNGVPGVALSKEKGNQLTPLEACRLVEPHLAGIIERCAGRDAATAFPPWHVLNVNIPDIPAREVRGTVLTRQGRSGFREWYTPFDDGPSARLGADPAGADLTPARLGADPAGADLTPARSSADLGGADLTPARSSADLGGADLTPAREGWQSFMLDGMMCMRDGSGDSDAEALSRGFVAVSPLVLDVNCRRAEDLFGWVVGARPGESGPPRALD